MRRSGGAENGHSATVAGLFPGSMVRAVASDTPPHPPASGWLRHHQLTTGNGRWAPVRLSEADRPPIFRQVHRAMAGPHGSRSWGSRVDDLEQHRVEAGRLLLQRSVAGVLEPDELLPWRRQAVQPLGSEDAGHIPVMATQQEGDRDLEAPDIGQVRAEQILLEVGDGILEAA